MNLSEFMTTKQLYNNFKLASLLEKKFRNSVRIVTFRLLIIWVLEFVTTKHSVQEFLCSYHVLANLFGSASIFFLLIKNASLYASADEGIGIDIIAFSCEIYAVKTCCCVSVK